MISPHHFHPTNGVRPSDSNDELLSKRQVFKAVTGTKKAVHLTMVTTEGVERNAYWNDVQSEVTLDDLFSE